MAGRREKCGYCREQWRRPGGLLCPGCRDLADMLIAATAPGLEVLVTGSGPWDGAPLPRPVRRFPGTAARQGG